MCVFVWCECVVRCVCVCEGGGRGPPLSLPPSSPIPGELSFLFFFALYTPVVMRAAYFESYRMTIGRPIAAGERAHRSA